MFSGWLQGFKSHIPSLSTITPLLFFFFLKLSINDFAVIVYLQRSCEGDAEFLCTLHPAPLNVGA